MNRFNEVLNLILGLKSAYRSQVRVNSLEEIYQFVTEQQKEIGRLEKEMKFWRDIAESCECNND